MKTMSLLVMALTARAVFAQVDRDQFVRDYNTAAALASSRLLTGEYRVTATGVSYGEAGAIVDEATVVFHVGHGCVLAELTIGKQVNGGPTAWYLLRPDGYFQIVPGKQPGEYLLKDSKLGRQQVYEVGFPLALLACHFTRFSVPLTNLLSDKTTQFVSIMNHDPFRSIVVTESIGGEQARTTYRLHTDDLALDSFRSGPAGRPVSVEAKFTYKQFIELRVPHTMDRYLIDSSGKPRLAGRIEFSDFEPASFPKADFTLARFGLPEPAGSKWHKRTPISFYLMSVAGALALISSALWAVARARRRSQSVPAGGL